MGSRKRRVAISVRRKDSKRVSIHDRDVTVRLMSCNGGEGGVRDLRGTVRRVGSALSPRRLRRGTGGLRSSFGQPLARRRRTCLGRVRGGSSFVDFFVPQGKFVTAPVLVSLGLLVFVLVITFKIKVLRPSALTLLG